MEFNTFRDLIKDRLEDISKQSRLYRVNIDGNELVTFYQDSFAPEDNPIFRERRAFDCDRCNSFVKNVGNLVGIIDGKIETIWDVPADGIYKQVAYRMKELILDNPIESVYYVESSDSDFGLKENEILVNEDGKTITPGMTFSESKPLTFDHFYGSIYGESIAPIGYGVGALTSKANNSLSPLVNILTNYSIESAGFILDLIDDDNLNRGSEYKDILTMFVDIKKAFDAIELDGSLDVGNTAKDIFIWNLAGSYLSSLANNVIGTLLEDLSSGIDVNVAVKKYESKVSGGNFMRSKPIISKRQSDEAMKTIDKLGLEPSLYRRPATIHDIKANNVIWANKALTNIKKTGVAKLLDESISTVKTKVDENGYTEIGINDFISNVVPKAVTIEISPSTNHSSNFMSLIAPVNDNIEPLFKWDNDFSWSYNGNVTDAVDDLVEAAGGSLSKDLRITISWDNTDDLDLHVIENFKSAEAFTIYHGRRESNRTNGYLDVDANADEINLTTKPVENITWTKNSSGVIEGLDKLVVGVHNYKERNGVQGSHCTITVYIDGVKTVYKTLKPFVNKSTLYELLIIDKIDGKFKITEVANDLIKEVDQNVYGITLDTFVQVNTIMYSPNFWDGQDVGNQHYFFMIENCKNPNSMRGMYNEFLRSDLREHRRAFEILADKMKCPSSDDQLSGLGFTTTTRAELLCRVTTTDSKLTYKIKF